jgi:hypothetical protein
MHTLGTFFDVLDENIRPPQERLDAARDLPPLLREYLRQHQNFATVEPHSRLVGSYAQDLSVTDVKDVDILVRVDGDPENNEPEAKQLIRELKAALDGVPEALGFVGWTDVDISGARRSVHVYLENRDFHFDVIPCVAPDGLEEALYVPDRGFNKWVPSHPVGFVQLLDELNKEHGRKVKRLGRLLKHFRDHQMKQRRPKSYWLGALLVHQVRGSLDTSQPLAVVFRDLLDGVYNRYASLLGQDNDATPNIPDPLLGHNISWNWGRPAFETFMRRLDDGRKWATKALDADDRETAISYWQRLFGEEFFPTEVEEAAKDQAEKARPGAAAVLGSGMVVSRNPGTGIYTPTRPTTFHGPASE